MVRTVIEDLSDVEADLATAEPTAEEDDLWKAANTEVLGIVASAGTSTNPGASDED